MSDGCENHLANIESKLSVLTWMLSFNTALEIVIFWKVFSA